MEKRRRAIRIPPYIQRIYAQREEFYFRRSNGQLEPTNIISIDDDGSFILKIDGQLSRPLTLEKFESRFVPKETRASEVQAPDHTTPTTIDREKTPTHEGHSESRKEQVLREKARAAILDAIVGLNQTLDAKQVRSKELLDMNDFDLMDAAEYARQGYEQQR